MGLIRQNKNMKTLIAITVIMLVGAGCTSTVTLGPKANEDGIVGASATTDGVSVTVPFVKTEVKSTSTPAETTKKK